MRLGCEQSDTTIAEVRAKKIETLGGNQKIRLLKQHRQCLRPQDRGH
jgi:ribosomal protein S8E